jgi:hypothetical protein
MVFRRLRHAVPSRALRASTSSLVRSIARLLKARLPQGLWCRWPTLHCRSGTPDVTCCRPAETSRQGSATVRAILINISEPPDEYCKSDRTSRKTELSVSTRDLRGVFKPKSVEESELKMKALSGLSAMLSQHQELADATNAVIVEPWTAVNLVLIQRAVDRGEVSPKIDIEMLSQVIPSICAYRTVVLRKPVAQPFLTAMIENVLLPALRNPKRASKQAAFATHK